VTAASWTQHDLLETYSTPDLRVYAIWFNMYAGDSRSKWPARVMTDPRVIHYWDEGRAVGTRYLSHLPALLERRAPATLAPTADAIWDAFFLYERGAKWKDPVPVPMSWGYPIMVTRDQLLQDVEATIAK
jgi:hypothetical protein